MKTGAEYWKQLTEIRNNIIADIIDTVPPNTRIKLGNLYLGDYSSEWSGYPEVIAVKHGRDGFHVFTEGPTETKTLEDYTVSELATLLEHINQKMK